MGNDDQRAERTMPSERSLLTGQEERTPLTRRLDSLTMERPAEQRGLFDAPAPPQKAVTPLAVAAALGAALATGLAWGALAHYSGYEIGIVAWAIGLAAGYATFYASGRRKGLPLQATAILAGLVGFLAGKFLQVQLVVNEVVASYTPEERANGGLDSPFYGLELFVTQPGISFSAFDLLWVALVAFGAWRILAVPKAAKA